MHDWTLIAVNFDWKSARAEFLFQHSAGNAVLIAEGVTELNLLKHQPWGPSVSVNRIEGPVDNGAGQQLNIEMQTGDIIKICAHRFTLPER